MCPRECPEQNSWHKLLVYRPSLPQQCTVSCSHCDAAAQLVGPVPASFSSMNSTSSSSSRTWTWGAIYRTGPVAAAVAKGYLRGIRMRLMMRRIADCVTGGRLLMLSLALVSPLYSGWFCLAQLMLPPRSQLQKACCLSNCKQAARPRLIFASIPRLSLAALKLVWVNTNRCQPASGKRCLPLCTRFQVSLTLLLC